MQHNYCDILTDPKNLKAYQAELANYAREQAGIFEYRGTLEKKLSTLNLGHILQQRSGIIDKAKSKGKKELTEGGIVSRAISCRF